MGESTRRFLGFMVWGTRALLLGFLACIWASGELLVSALFTAMFGLAWALGGLERDLRADRQQQQVVVRGILSDYDVAREHWNDARNCHPDDARDEQAAMLESWVERLRDAQQKGLNHD